MKIQVTGNLMSKKLEGEWVLLDLESGVYYGLNETGSVIWDGIKGRKDTETILDDLESQFGSNRARLKKDLDQFLGDLKKENLIDVGDSLP
jgi:hypothetical protein